MEYDADYGDSYEDETSEFEYAYGDHEQNEDTPSYSVPELWELCLMPTIYDGFYAAKLLLGLCLLFRFTLLLGLGRIPPIWCHLTLGSAGMFCLHHFFGLQLLFVVLLALLGLAAIRLAHITLGKYRGVSCATVCAIYLISCELFIVEKAHWHKIRGSQMILTMKLISLAYDTDTKGYPLPSIMECFGYFFCVGTVIFGPWVNYIDYASIHEKTSMGISWLLNVGKTLLLSFIFLTVSTCWATWLLPDSLWTNFRWIIVYRDALAFRASHYFVCYLAETTATVVGISSLSSKGTSPSHVELPRSLVEVVIYWNMPMHRWLKIYVFKNAQPYGAFFAILLTYAASSLLHGLNFQLAAVLLSLGFYTYIEFVLRKKLASTFDACVAARKCIQGCHHTNDSSHPYVMATNIGFALLSIFHLAYLGVMFDSSSSLQEEGYSMQHTLSKWSDLNFASHWVALATFVLNAFI